MEAVEVVKAEVKVVRKDSAEKHSIPSKLSLEESPSGTNGRRTPFGAGGDEEHVDAKSDEQVERRGKNREGMMTCAQVKDALVRSDGGFVDAEKGREYKDVGKI